MASFQMTELYKDKTTMWRFKEEPDRQISHISFDSHGDTRKRSNPTDHKYISQGLPLGFFFMSLIYSMKICYVWNFVFLMGKENK